MTARKQVGSPSFCTKVCSGWCYILANHSKESFPCSGRCVPAFCPPSCLCFGQSVQKVVFLEVGARSNVQLVSGGKLSSQDENISSSTRDLCLETLPQSHFASGDQSPSFSLASTLNIQTQRLVCCRLRWCLPTHRDT